MEQRSIFEVLSSGSSRFVQPHSSSSTLLRNYDVRSKVDKHAKQIQAYVIADEFVEGEISKTQLYLEKLYAADPFLFKDSFTRAWVNIFGLQNEQYLYTFASIASCLPYHWLEHHGISLILGCSAHNSELVNEACIRLVESWEQPSHLSYLRKLRRFETDWLESYRQSVIEFLERLSR